MHSGVTREEVERAYLHLFINEYDLDGGRKRFDPGYDIAVSWQRLRDGEDVLDQDIILLKHEAYEYELMQQGIPYDQAHAMTEMYYNYSKAVDDYNRRKEGGDGIS